MQSGVVGSQAWIERLIEQQEQVRTEFSARFAAFSAPEQRALVKKTFA